VVYTTGYGQLRHCGPVIEAATENLDLKRKIFEKVEGVADEIACTDAAKEGITALFGKKGTPIHQMIFFSRY